MNDRRAELLKAIGEYMLIETPLARADLCLVFGCKSYPDHLALHAAELYHQGYYGFVIVSGGVATDDGRLEAYRLRDILVERGVPEKNILVEDRATNTGENVLYAMELLAEKGLLGGIGSVLAVGHIPASRRFVMTLEKRWPEVIKLFSTHNHFGVPRAEWFRHRELRRRVFAAYRKIKPYKKQDFIAEIDLEKIFRDIARNLSPPRPPAS